MKQVQDETLPPHEHYIRTILNLPNTTGAAQNDELEYDSENSEENLRIVVCMSPEGSSRLLRAQYIQSDIAFRRVVGYQEFELATFDREGNTSMSSFLWYLSVDLTVVTGVVFCRVFVNHATAVAHQQIFQEIEKLVVIDTGQHLKWRHLHASSTNEYVGILHWAADQHGGQAKGM